MERVEEGRIIERMQIWCTHGWVKIYSVHQNMQTITAGDHQKLEIILMSKSMSSSAEYSYVMEHYIPNLQEQCSLFLIHIMQCLICAYLFVLICYLFSYLDGNL